MACSLAAGGQVGRAATRHPPRRRASQAVRSGALAGVRGRVGTAAAIGYDEVRALVVIEIGDRVLHTPQVSVNVHRTGTSTREQL